MVEYDKKLEAKIQGNIADLIPKPTKKETALMSIRVVFSTSAIF